MKKLLAILLAISLMLSLCACAGEGEGPTPDKPGDQQNPPSDPDPEPDEPAPEPPIEVSEFGDLEDMPEPLDGSLPAEFSSADYALTVGDRTFDLEWIYYHNIYDWAQAGFTYDQINEKTPDYLGLPLNADAINALKNKISDFTMLTFMGTADGTTAGATPEITVNDDAYDFEWLTSHNATEYTEAGIPADTLKQYMEAIEADYWYTPEYRWLKIVYDRLVNGW